jgi:hypothetical protein
VSGLVLPGFEKPTKPPSLYSHAAVALYRKVCKYKPNQLQRELIVETVGEGPSDVSLYKEILVQFMAEGRPPQRVDWTLERFIKAQPQTVGRIEQTSEGAWKDIEKYDGPFVAEDSIEGRIWTEALKQMSLKISLESYQTWFQPLRLISLDRVERTVRLWAPRPSISSWVATNFSTALEESLAAAGLISFSVVWSVGQESEAA